MILSLGYDAGSAGSYSFSYYDNIAGGDFDGNGLSDEYSYITLGAGFGDFSVTLGSAMYGAEGLDVQDYTHLDLSYAYNDNVAFTFSQIIDQEEFDNSDDEFYDDDLNFVVSYSLPLGE